MLIYIHKGFVHSLKLFQKTTRSPKLFSLFVFFVTYVPFDLTKSREYQYTICLADDLL